MGRRVESGINGPAMGRALAHQEVELWIMNDQPVLERLRAIVRGDDGFRGDKRWPVLRVREFVMHLLYTDDGSSYRSTWRLFYGDKFPVSGFDSTMPTYVRERFERDDVEHMDWDEFMSQLMEGVDE